MKTIGKDIFRILLGSAILALGLDLFLSPADLVTGGVTGFGIILEDITEKAFGKGIPLSLTNLLVNVPLLITAWIVKGKKFIAKTAVATLALSLFLYLFESLVYTTGDMMINTIFGSALSGIGLGLVFAAEATTGGTDLIAAIVQHYNKHLSVAKLLMVVDGVVVLAGVLVFGIDKTLYAVIGVYLTALITDQVIDGFHYSKAIYIISDYGEEIAAEIMRQIDRGVTGFNGEGMYTHKEKKILLCTSSVKESVHIRQIAHAIDPTAFMIVTDVREVFGEGFVENHKEN